MGIALTLIFRPWYAASEQISHRNSTPRPCSSDTSVLFHCTCKGNSLYSQKGIYIRSAFGSTSRHEPTYRFSIPSGQRQYNFSCYNKHNNSPKRQLERVVDLPIVFFLLVVLRVDLGRWRGRLLVSLQLSLTLSRCQGHSSFNF